MPPERDDPWHGRTRRTRDPNPESGFGFNPSFSPSFVASRSPVGCVCGGACALALKHERESVHQQGSRAAAEASRQARIRASPAQPLAGLVCAESRLSTHIHNSHDLPGQDILKAVQVLLGLEDAHGSGRSELVPFTVHFEGRAVTRAASHAVLVMDVVRMNRQGEK
ncbi:hypothetical protein LQW54_008411 [Pestalotiopsis sp. IQ-011]